MDGPFIYNKYVTGKHFIGRKTELAILGNLLGQGEHVALYEAPKTGITSLIQQTFYNMQIAGHKFNVAECSLLNTRTLSEILLRIGSTILRLFGSTPDEYAALAAAHLGGTHFIFDPEAYARTDSVLSLNWDIDDGDIRAILTLAEHIAAERGTHCFVVLGGFHNILLAEDGERMLKLFEQVIHPADKAPNTASYLFTGSRVNAMKEIFEQKRYFYRTVEHLALSEIDPKDIIEHTVRGFLTSGKVIDRDLLPGVCRLFQGNIWYINHFSAICDALSKGYIMENVLMEALDTLLSIHSPRFIATMEDLTTFQTGLLKAVLQGNTRFSSAEVIRRYGLNSSANVRRLKDALCKKEILTFNEKDEPVVLDPLFRYWASKYYFEIEQA